jgi:HAD superfamily hydrolase (TIGR01484 family)
VTNALLRLSASGRKLILATGRRLEDLFLVYPNFSLFDYLVCENGALLYRPATKTAKILAAPPPKQFIEMIEARGVSPLEKGRVIVATWHPNESKILEAIHELGLDLQITFNKGAVMVLPPAINKGTGTNVALSELGLSKHNLLAIGDAENDLSMLAQSECAVAVANAISTVKEYADLTVNADHGQGVVEIIERLLATDLAECGQFMRRRNLTFGRTAKDEPFGLRSYDFRTLIAGPSQSGKSTISMALLDQFASDGYQYCVIDPEGEYDHAPHSVTVGNVHYSPEVEDVIRVLENPEDNVVVNLLGVPLSERADYLAQIFTAIQTMRRVKGRPHWLVIDEAHHMLHPFWQQTIEPIWKEPGAVILITVDPAEISQTVLSGVDLVLAVGQEPMKTLATFSNRVGHKLPDYPDHAVLGWGQALAWFRHEYGAPYKVTIASPTNQRQRHLRKYADGNLGNHRSFYFTGPHGKLKIKCQNLFMFMQVGDGVDDDTWMFHLRRQDYSNWLKNIIGDDELAEQVASIEKNIHLSAAKSRSRINTAIETRYTSPARILI